MTCIVKFSQLHFFQCMCRKDIPETEITVGVNCHNDSIYNQKLLTACIPKGISVI